MDKKELIAAVAAVLTTALEVGEPCPESSVYLALGGNMEKWEIVRGILLKGGLITIKGYSIGLTPLGKDTAEKINAALATR